MTKPRSLRAINIEDLRSLAQRRVPKVVFDYIDGGAEAIADASGGYQPGERFASVSEGREHRYVADADFRSALAFQ
jgi:hypothetical protein